jgi:TRAP transporter 4TM/12TM fusion protein
MNERMRTVTVSVLGILLCAFTLFQVNYPTLQPQSQLAVFGLFGLVICFLVYPVHPRLKDSAVARFVDLLLALATVGCFGYVIVQTEPYFKDYWLLGQSLGNRAGIETGTDLWVGLAGLLLVLEATRRSIGLALPLLSLAFIAHAYYAESLPDWLLPHSASHLDEIISDTFLQSLGVFGPAMNVMFTYVFLFVIFGSFLEAVGATQFIVDFAERIFGRSPGGPAKVAVLGSGLMGSLSGSAVANAVTTGSFTIPMMRNAGFQPHISAGITAAAASGGALVPPVMGAGAYMMLEIIDPPVTFLQIVKAALIPALLYYFSILMIVHYYSLRTGTADRVVTADDAPKKTLAELVLQFQGLAFVTALGTLILFLLLGYSPFAAVTISLGAIVLLGLNRPLHWAVLPVTLGVLGWSVYADFSIIRSLLHTVLAASALRLVFGGQQLTLPMTVTALTKSAKNGVSLVSASACVGIVIGIVQTTGVAGQFNEIIKDVVEQSLLMALIGIMVCSIILGMGVPSVVCYLLMATLMGSLLKELGVEPLAAHLFIFYFGMMSMVTPPVALAAFASASIANANIMRSGFAAFMFALVGFTLPFMFVYRPELLLLTNRPEVKVDYEIDEQSAGAAVKIKGQLQRIGKELPDVRVELEPANGSSSPQAGQTDANGRFLFEVAGAGQWRLAAYNAEEERLHLGTFDIDPTRQVQDESQIKEGDAPKKKPVEFLDQRLSPLQVLMATAAAGLGILALAAGIAGYLRSQLNPLLRLLAFATAALLLYPGRGFLVGDLRIALSDLAGLGVFLLLLALNRPKKIESDTVPAEAAT